MRRNNIVSKSFLRGESANSGNVTTDGQSLYLFGNKIAEHRPDGLWITNCGWGTVSTRAYLNQLPNVSASQHKKEQLLNGEVWDGNWTKVNNDPPPSFNADKVGKQFVTSTHYVRTDGWRGYSEPDYAVCGANDTGSWDDSPCPSNVRAAEIKEVATKLKAAAIPCKEQVCESSNVFCVHVYLIVPPAYFEQAKQIVADHIDNTSTRLLYACNTK